MFDETSFRYNDKGDVTFAYLKDEIAGFAVHFNQKQNIRKIYRYQPNG